MPHRRRTTTSKVNPLQWIGSLLLLAAMMFAVMNLSAADQWIAQWVPFVVAGVALVLVGTISPGNRPADDRSSCRPAHQRPSAK